jgi:hypothetical protein
MTGLIREPSLESISGRWEDGTELNALRRRFGLSISVSRIYYYW